MTEEQEALIAALRGVVKRCGTATMTTIAVSDLEALLQLVTPPPKPPLSAKKEKKEAPIDEDVQGSAES